MKEVKQTENGGRKMTLEEKIKHYRKQAGLSQEKMAEKIGVSRQAIPRGKMEPEHPILQI